MNQGQSSLFYEKISPLCNETLNISHPRLPSKEVLPQHRLL